MFQEQRNEYTERAITAGIVKGSRMRLNSWKGVAPLTSAASSTSLGMESKYSAAIHALNGETSAAKDNETAQSVFKSLYVYMNISMNIGIDSRETRKIYKKLTFATNDLTFP